MGIVSSTTLLLYIQTILPLHAQIDFALPDQPLLNETNVPTFPCHGDFAVSGWFRFLQNHAEAWFHAESGFLYFEYFFPQFMWTAIAVSNQTNKGENTGCLDCYVVRDPLSIQNCLSECVGGNEFVITGQSDPTHVILDRWRIWEVDFTDNGDSNDEQQFQIERGRGIGTVTDSFRELVTAPNGLPYVHGWWKRSWTNSDGDEWEQPTDGGDPFCVTTISSEEGDPIELEAGRGPYMAGLNSHAHKEYTEIHCVNTTVVCSEPTEQPTLIPTIHPSEGPTVSPSPAPTRDAIPSLNVEVDSGVCVWANMTLIILVDASESVGGTNWEMSKQWITDVFDDANNVIKTQQDFWRDKGWNITLCMRTALILFSSQVDVKWDLNEHGECYNAIKMHEVIWNMERPHDPLDTIYGTHTADALWEAYEMVKEQRHDDERSMVLLLTDGLPQAVQGDDSQNPCFLNTAMGALPRGYASSTNSNPDGQDIALKVVAVGEEMNNLQPFLCFETVDFIEVGALVDLSEYNTEVNNQFFNEFCRVLTYGCNIPIYPHQDGTRMARYNTSITDLVMDGSITGFLYTFRVRDRYQTDDRSVDIWPHEASIQAESFCLDDNITLSATLWRWENDSVVDPNPIHSENDANVIHFTHDKDDDDQDGDTYNWYNFTFPTNPDSALLRGAVYTLEINIDYYGSCSMNDLQFRVQSPTIQQGIMYQTEYFDDVFLKYKDNAVDDDWYPDVLSSVESPNRISEQWPFVTLCINEFPLPPTLYPTREPTPAPTESPTPFPTSSPTISTMDPTDAPTPSPTDNPTDAPTPAPTRVPSTIPSKTPTEEPTIEPTEDPTVNPTPAPTSVPSDDPSPAPTDSPTASPTHSPHWVSNCTWSEDTDVIFVVDESCGLTSTEMTLQNEFVADMIQRVKIDSTYPRLGYIGCREDPEVVIQLDHVMYNSALFPIEPADVKQMSLIIRDRVYLDRGGPPPRDMCITMAMDQFDENDQRNKKIVLMSNCRESTFSDVCALVHNEIADFGDYIDFIIVNIDTANVRENHCLERRIDRHFYISNFNNLVAHSPPVEELVEEICEAPTPSPNPAPTDIPSPAPTNVPSNIPTRTPSDVPSPGPISPPTDAPTKSPTDSLADSPTAAPTNMPSPTEQSRTHSPSHPPTRISTNLPTLISMTVDPTREPSLHPTTNPLMPSPVSFPPSESPTRNPSIFPTKEPTTSSPTYQPFTITFDLTESPSLFPTSFPSKNVESILAPTMKLTDAPTPIPTPSPSINPTKAPSQEPTKEPSRRPSASPSRAPSAAPSDDPSPAPTNSPTASPTHSPHWVSNCTWSEDTDVIFVVDESCGLTSTEMTLQNEFIADMIQRVKIDSTDPRLGYIGCREDPEAVIALHDFSYNSNLFPIGSSDIKQMSLIIRDRVYLDRGCPPPRDMCITMAMDQFVENDGRNKKIVLMSNCRENTFSDVCALVDNEIADFGDHIDFIIVNVDTRNIRENHCLEKSIDHHFYISNFNNLVAHSPAAEELVEEICEAPTPSPTDGPSGVPTKTPRKVPCQHPKRQTGSISSSSGSSLSSSFSSDSSSWTSSSSFSSSGIDDDCNDDNASGASSSSSSDSDDNSSDWI